MIGEDVDIPQTTNMVDAFLEAGFNYFDTAHGYIDGKSETAIRDCLSARYDREDFVLANKLSAWFFEKEEDVVPLFESQLALCGVEYFDFYLVHCVDEENIDAYLDKKKGTVEYILEQIFRKSYAFLIKDLQFLMHQHVSDILIK